MKEGNLGFSIVDILSMGASISTMIGLLVAAIGLWNYYREKRKKLEYEVKKDFYDAHRWDSFTNNEELNYFALNMSYAPFSQILGEIEYLEYKKAKVIPIEKFAFFEILKSHKKEITLQIFQAIYISEEETGKKILGTATLEHITPFEFRITFNKDCLPSLPRTAELTCLSHYAKITRERKEDREKDELR